MAEYYFEVKLTFLQRVLTFGGEKNKVFGTTEMHSLLSNIYYAESIMFAIIYRMHQLPRYKYALLQTTRYLRCILHEVQHLPLQDLRLLEVGGNSDAAQCTGGSKRRRELSSLSLESVRSVVSFI